MLNDLIHVQKKKVDANDMKMMLGDVFDVYASLKTPLLIKIVESSKYLDQLLPNKKANSQVKQWIEDLKQWNYRFEHELKEPTIFSLWEFYIVDTLFKSQIQNDKLRRYASKLNGYDGFLVGILEKLLQDPTYFSEYCSSDNLNSADACIKMVTDGIIFAYNYLEPTDPSLSTESLKFKHWHKIEYKYSPFSNTFLRVFFNRNDIDDGSKNTLNVGTIYYSEFDAKGLESQHTAAYRMIVDFGSDKDCQFSVDTGVSENIIGNYFYFNLHEPYKTLKLVPMNFNSLNTTQTQRFATLRLIYKDWFDQEEARRMKAEQKKTTNEEKVIQDL